MSKVQLKKTLKNFPADELIELIGQAYDAKVLTARDFFEFWLEPDEKTLLARVHDVIAKEFLRSKYGRAKFKITNVRKQFAILKAYGIDSREIAQTMMYAFSCGCRVAAFVGLTEAQIKSIGRLLTDLLTFIDSHSLYGDMIEKIVETIDAVPENWRTRSFCNHIKGIVKNFKTGF